MLTYTAILFLAKFSKASAKVEGGRKTERSYVPYAEAVLALCSKNRLNQRDIWNKFLTRAMHILCTANGGGGCQQVSLEEFLRFQWNFNPNPTQRWKKKEKQVQEAAPLVLQT